MKILLAIRESEKSEISSFLQKVRISTYILDTLSDFDKISSHIQLALIDEDFDGPDTGWRLAQIIRHTMQPIKIVMIVRKIRSMILYRYMM